MKPLLSALLAAALFLPACFPKKPEITLPEVPAETMVRALKFRRQSFTALSALASVQVVRKGRRRAFDTVGILLKSQEKFRIEAFGPLGRPILALAWNGKELQLKMAGDDRIHLPGPSVIEKLLGLRLELSVLSALLSGNIPAEADASKARAFCGQDSGCVVELNRGTDLSRVWGVFTPREASGRFIITAYEEYHGEKLLYRAQYSPMENIGGYPFPMNVLIESPGRKVKFAVEYSDVELNQPLDNGRFTLSEQEDPAP